MYFGKKPVFLWSLGGVSVVGVLFCTAVSIVVVIVVVIVQRLILPFNIVPLILCPLEGLGKGFEV